MLAKYFRIIRNYVLSVSSQRKFNFYHENTLLDAFRTNSRNIIGRNPSMVIPLLANQDLTPMLVGIEEWWKNWRDSQWKTLIGEANQWRKLRFFGGARHLMKR